MTEWTSEELETLRKLYRDPSKTIGDVMRELPGRTANAIRLKASRENIPRPLVELQQQITLNEGEYNGVNFDPLNNTITVYKPIEISELLTYIKEIKRDWGLI